MYCKHYLDMKKPYIVVIMETKNDANNLRRNLSSNGFDCSGGVTEHL